MQFEAWHLGIIRDVFGPVAKNAAKTGRKVWSHVEIMSVDAGHAEARVTDGHRLVTYRFPAEGLLTDPVHIEASLLPKVHIGNAAEQVELFAQVGLTYGSQAVAHAPGVRLPPWGAVTAMVDSVGGDPVLNSSYDVDYLLDVVRGLRSYRVWAKRGFALFDHRHLMIDLKWPREENEPARWQTAWTGNRERAPCLTIYLMPKAPR